MLSREEKIILGSPRVSFAVVGLSIVLASLLAAATYINLLVPMHAWDVLDFWGPTAKSFILHVEGGENASFVIDHRHPVTVSQIMGWSQRLGGEGSFYLNFWALPWLFSWASAALVLAVYGAYLRCSPELTLVSMVLALSLPLSENHVISSGYAEPFLGLLLLCSSALIAAGLGSGRRLLILFGLLVSLLQCWLKNTGIVYAALPFVALVFCWLTSPAHTSRLRLSIGLSALLTFPAIFVLWKFYTGGWLYLPGGNHIAFNESVGFLMGKRLALMEVSIVDIIRNHLYSWFLNQSFSTAFLLIMLAMLNSLLVLTEQMKFVSMVIILGLLVLAASQLTDHGFIHAVPENDTGNSRFTLPVAGLAPLIFLMSFGGHKPLKDREKTVVHGFE